MINKFENFLKENKEYTYKLYIEDNDIFSDISWDISMDFSNLWEKYENKKININDFIKNYKFIVNDYKNKIIEKKGVEIWNELVLILNNFKEYNSNMMHKKMDEIYDWGDKNNIEIKT